MSEYINGVTYCHCKNCGSDEAIVDTSVVLTSYPPMYKYHWPKCEDNGYVYTNETFGIFNQKIDITMPAPKSVSIRNWPEIKKISTSKGSSYPSVGDVINKVNEIIDILNKLGEEK